MAGTTHSFKDREASAVVKKESWLGHQRATVQPGNKYILTSMHLVVKNRKVFRTSFFVMAKIWCIILKCSKSFYKEKDG